MRDDACVENGLLLVCHVLRGVYPFGVDVPKLCACTYPSSAVSPSKNDSFNAWCFAGIKELCAWGASHVPVLLCSMICFFTRDKKS